jgi:hypothetical protein
MTDNQPHDPLLEAAIDRAMADVGDLLPPDLAEELRRGMRLGLGMHPRAQDILRRLRAAPVDNTSGAVRTSEYRDEEESNKAGGAR